MTNWQWKVILALVRYVLTQERWLERDDFRDEKDKQILIEALSREDE